MKVPLSYVTRSDVLPTTLEPLAPVKVIGTSHDFIAEINQLCSIVWGELQQGQRKSLPDHPRYDNWYTF